jgi:hypothetical protein
MGSCCIAGWEAVHVFKDVSLCTLNILKVMYTDFMYAWGDRHRPDFASAYKT